MTVGIVAIVVLLFVALAVQISVLRALREINRQLDYHAQLFDELIDLITEDGDDDYDGDGEPLPVEDCEASVIEPRAESKPPLKLVVNR